MKEHESRFARDYDHDGLCASIRPQALKLKISLHGTDRDDYIESQVCHFLRDAGLTATSTEHRTKG